MFPETTDQAIRREQTNFVRSTLGLPAGKKPYQAGEPGKRPFNKGHKPAVKSAKPQGHEAYLKHLEVSGGEIEVLFLDDDETLTGRVRHSDKFTVSIQETPESDTVVLFKHALRGFKVKTPPPSQESKSADQE
jgi:sRNA-binding regulator protein Hfq